MADAAARREARRKRILENSENRLRIISGLPTVDDTGELPDGGINRKTPSTLSWERDDSPNEFPEFQRILPSSSSINSDGSYTEQIRLRTSLNQEGQPVVEPFLLSNPQQSADSLMVEQQPVSIFSALFSSRLYLVGLAVVVRLLLATSYCNLFGESIFIPLITLQIVKYFGNISDVGNAKSNSSILNAALLFSGIPVSTVGRLTRVFTTVKELLEDFYIYFFSFIALHVVLEFLS